MHNVKSTTVWLLICDFNKKYSKKQFSKGTARVALTMPSPNKNIERKDLQGIMALSGSLRNNCWTHLIVRVLNRFFYQLVLVRSFSPFYLYNRISISSCP